MKIAGTKKEGILQAGLDATGTLPTRRGRGWSDYDVIRQLAQAGLLEPRSSGPRGGTRWHTTPAGATALADARA